MLEQYLPSCGMISDSLQILLANTVSSILFIVRCVIDSDEVRFCASTTQIANQHSSHITAVWAIF